MSPPCSSPSPQGSAAAEGRRDRRPTLPVRPGPCYTGASLEPQCNYCRGNPDLVVAVQPSEFKTAARKMREEAPGAEEVHEDENTAVEIPVDQVETSV